MHHTVSAEAVGAKETGHTGYHSENRMMIGRHLIEASPRLLRIDGDILKAGHAISSALQYLLDERRLEVSLVNGGLGGIIPGKQESQRLGPEVKAVGHIDRHRRRVRIFVKRL